LTIGKFPSYRRADLWSGIGLACAYAGGVSRDEIQALQRAAGTYAPHLAQGAAFAAKCRQLAGNETDHTDLACQVFAGVSATQAAAVTDESLKDLPDNAAYEVWRERIRTALSSKNS
jgi:hypothetical protein